MKTLSLPGITVDASVVILGLMRSALLSDSEIRALVGTARDSGVTMFDHADVYGSEAHGAERRFGEAGAVPAAERDQVIIQSKVGIREGYFDFSHDHILDAVDESLAALKTDYLDILLLHRPDALVEPDEVASAFDTLHRAGKVRAFGVSNHTPGQIELLKRSVKQPLIVNQVQFSITHAALVSQGIAANMSGLEQSVDRGNGILDYSRLHDITVQAWSPFQRQFFDGVFLGDTERYPELNSALDQIAEKYSTTPTGVALAWILRHPAAMQVVVGTTNPGRVVESAAGADTVLTREEWYLLFRAAGHTVP